jgi:hypothetical protein
VASEAVETQEKRVLNCVVEKKWLLVGRYKAEGAIFIEKTYYGTAYKAASNCVSGLCR